MPETNAAAAALVLAKVLNLVEEGNSLPWAYDHVFGQGAYAKIANDIWEAANK